MHPTRTLAIVGAGAVGIEAALYGAHLGYAVSVYEQAVSLAEVCAPRAARRCYAPWRLMVSPLGRRAAQESDPAWSLAQPDAVPTVAAYYEQYLARLAAAPALAGRIHFGRRVQAIARKGLRKGDLLGTPARAEHPFRLFLAGADGGEQDATADIVIDASGVYGTPNPIGQGWPLARTERALADQVPHVMQIDAAWLDQHAVGKTVLLVGESLEGLDVACRLVDLVGAAPGTRLIWSILREDALPYADGARDPLPARQAAIEQLRRDLVSREGARCVGGSSIAAVERHPDGGWRVSLAQAHGTTTVHADVVIANTGYRPDAALYRDLQIHQCYASDAPMALAAAMLGAAPNAFELTTSLGADTLKNPEPGFFILGRKSYGRSEGFIPAIGLGQIVEAFATIEQKPDLDRYQALDPDAPRFTRAAQPVARPAPATRRLSDSEQQFKSIVEHVKEVVFQTDIQHKLVYLSPSWTTLTGLEGEGYLGRMWMELLHPDDRDAGLSQCNLFVNRDMASYHEEFRILTHDGATRQVEVNAEVLVNLDGKAYGTIGTMTDITERWQAQAALKQMVTLAEERLSELDQAHQEAERTNRILNETIAQQEQLLQTIRDLSAPLLPVHDQILVLPLIGHVDSVRSTQITEALLEGVQQHHAQFVIIDITGVSVVDTSVANHLLQATRAVGLLGARCILVGIGPEIAQTIVQLGIDLSALVTRSDLRAGIEYAIGSNGVGSTHQAALLA